MLSTRDALPAEERAAASSRICERTLAELAGRRVVALYAPKGSEVDTLALDAALRATGIGVVYPRIFAEGRELTFHVCPLADLARSRFGLREPSPIAPRFDIAQIDAFCIPGLAFDRAGWRIGWGRGHYDATLAFAAKAALRLGLAFECQIASDLPHDDHDARMHAVITEANVYRSA